MAASDTRHQLLDGLRDAVPVAIATSTFAILFGATASKAGLDMWQTLFASAGIFAGASQFVFLELYGLRVPAWSIVVTVLAINFRHVLYSASIGRKLREFSVTQRYGAFFLLVDPLFASAEHRSQHQKLTPAYYFACGGFMYVNWILFTAIGSWFGALIGDPQKYGLDFLLPLYFLTLVMGFRKQNHWFWIVIASTVFGLVIYKLAGPPWHVSGGSTAGILLAVLLGKKQSADEGGDVG